MDLAIRSAGKRNTISSALLHVEAQLNLVKGLLFDFSNQLFQDQQQTVNNCLMQKRHFIDRSQRPRPCTNWLFARPDPRDKSDNGRQVLKKSFTGFKLTLLCFRMLGRLSRWHCKKEPLLQDAPETVEELFQWTSVCQSHGILNGHRVHHRDMAIYIGEKENCSSMAV